MKHFNTIVRLASKFANKIAQYQQSQKGTSELFFDDPSNQQKFSAMIQDPNGSVAKYLLSVYNKTNQAASFDLKINSEPKAGASWVLKVSPASLTEPVRKLIDQEFKKLMNQSMSERLVAAVSAAKAGGSGPLNVGSLDIS